MIVILDNIRSGYNVGAILRTVEFFGITEVFLCGITPGPEHREVKKTGLGAEKILNVKKYFSTLRLVKKFKKEGFKILALEQYINSIPIYQYRIKNYELRKASLVVGNEITGINKKILQLADYILEIPKQGRKESLNVSVATGIAIYQLLQDFS